VTRIGGTAAAASESRANAARGSFSYAVECEQALLFDLAARALDGLCRLRHGGLEIGGVLYGQREPGRIIVKTARQLECDHALGPAFRLSQADEERLKALMSAPGADPELQGLETVGWYVSHTRSGLELTPHDLEIFSRCFTHPAHFVLVIKPLQFEPAAAAYFARGLDGILRADTPFLEFRIELRRDAAPFDSPAVPYKSSQAATETGMQAIAPPSRKGRALAAGLGLAAALAGAAALVWLNASGPAAAKQSRTAAVERSPNSPRAESAAHETAESVSPVRAQFNDQKPPAPAEDRVRELERELALLRARLRQSQLPQPSGAADRRAEAPPRVEVAMTPPSAPNVNPGDVSQLVRQLNLPPQVSLPPAPAPPPPASPASLSVHPVQPGAPAAGRIIWTGTLRKGGVLFIEGRQCSSGVVTSALPGFPVRIHAWPAELTDNGMIVYSNDPKRSGRSESPGPNNGWNYTAYVYEPARAAGVRVLESPAAQNGWKKIVVRSEEKSAFIVVIDWEALPR
jgi:hypothetical protein